MPVIPIHIDSDAAAFLCFFFFVAMFALIGIYIADKRGDTKVGGFLAGLLLGPVGLLILLLSGSPCAYCKRRIHSKAVKCPHCLSILAGGNAEQELTDAPS